MNIYYEDSFKETTFDKIRIGRTFATDYNGHRDLYIRIAELADPEDPEFRYNAIDLELGGEVYFENSSKVIPVPITITVPSFGANL